MPSPLETALEYLGLGFAVFPVGPDCRSPWVKGGCYAASRDPRVVAAWARTKPGAMVAAACGTPSGVVVLDVDAKGERDGFADLDDLQARNGKLPRTWMSETPSGGRHLWFARPGPGYRWRQWPDDRRFTNAAPLVIRGRKSGLDVRDTGASAALPPSRKSNGSYRWLVGPWETAPAPLPAWLISVMDPPPPPRAPVRPLRLSEADKAARYVEAVVNGECRELASMARDSGRNQRLFRAAANLGSLVGAGVLSESLAERALEQAADECGLIREDGRRSVALTIASGMRRGLANPREIRA